MSVVLRASGPNFDVDAFVPHDDWDIANFFRRGEPVLPDSQHDWGTRKESGLYIVVSDADMRDLPAQVADAIAFLSEYSDEIRRLVDFPGVEGVELDFGIERRDTATQYDRFPAELVRLAGACGLALELSQYPISDDEPLTE